jgi:hypothetical protein
MATLKLTATTLTEFEQFESLYELFQKSHPISLSIEAENIVLLLSNGTFLYTDLNAKTIKAEGTWKSLLKNNSISSCLINTEFPCVLSLSNGNMLYLTSANDTGNIRNTQGPDLNTISFKLPTGNSYDVKMNFTGRLLLMTTLSDIQVIGLSNKNEMLAFSPFNVDVLDPPVDNSVNFSRKFSNLFYYIDKNLNTPSILFGTTSNHCYTINKGIVDQKEIIEN